MQTGDIRKDYLLRGPCRFICFNLRRQVCVAEANRLLIRYKASNRRETKRAGIKNDVGRFVFIMRLLWLDIGPLQELMKKNHQH